MRETVARLFGVSPKELEIGGDDCGVHTYVFPLVDVARAFGFLADPGSATPTLARAASAPAT